MSSPLGTFRRYLEDRSPRAFQAFYGSRWVGAIGIALDGIASAAIDAWKAPLQQHPEGPAYDALQLLGKETGIPQLAGEPWDVYKERLQDPWETWSYAGTEQCLNEQLTLSIFSDARVFRYDANGSESEFVVYFPPGSHPVTSQGPTVGSFVVGDGTIIGPEGLDPGQLLSVKTLIRHWKSAFWKCPWAVFQISGWVVGDGTVVGDGSVIGGGEQARTRVQ